MKRLIFVKSVFLIVALICSNVHIAEAKDVIKDDKEQAVYEWFCKAQRDNGLIQSAEGLDMCGLYQMATAAMVFTLYGDYDRAEKIFDFYNGKLKEEFSGPKVSERGFIMFHHADGAPYYDTSRWLGDNAWFLMAINHYRSVTGKTKYDGMAKQITQWIDDLQDKKGKEYPEHNDLGIWGGFEGANNGKFMRFKSTESCIDSYVALYPYKDKKALQADIATWLDTMYIPQEKKFIIGSNIYGRDEKTDSEMQAWAYMAFRGSSRYPIDLDYLEKNYKLTVKSDDTGKEVTGFAYMPEDHKLGRLEVAPTLAIIAAYYLAGEDKKADFYLKEMEKILIKSRFYPSTMGMPGVANKSRYPNDPSDVHNVTVYTSAWYLFVKKRFNPFQNWPEKGEGEDMKITSPEFESGKYIPAKFTCDGADISPALIIEGIPKEAKSLALIVDDPDAPGRTWVHWVVYDIPIRERIDENSVPGKQGMTDSGKKGYGGPCPPSGTHRYFFKIYALDKALNLNEGIRKPDLEKAMQGHILDKAELIGLYKRGK